MRDVYVDVGDSALLDDADVEGQLGRHADGDRGLALERTGQGDLSERVPAVQLVHRDTDIDIDGQTVEVDLLQYLIGADQEAYEAAHPTEYAGCGCDDAGPIHNDNPRLRRLPVAADLRVFLQGSTSSSCDGSNTTTFAAFPGYFSNGDHDYEPDTGHLGFNAFWLTVDHDTVVDIEEMSCVA